MEKRVEPRPYLGDWVRLDALHPEWVNRQPEPVQEALRLCDGHTCPVVRVDRARRTVFIDPSLSAAGFPEGIGVPVDQLSPDVPRLSGHPAMPSLPDVLHVGRGELDSIGAVGARHIARSRDTLGFGPSHLDDRKHVARRSHWWAHGFGWKAAGRRFTETTRAALAATSKRPVVLWGTDEWPAQLHLWRVAHLWPALRRDRLPWLAQPDAAWRSARTQPRVFGVLSAFELAPMFVAAQPTTRKQLSVWARGWRAWCGSSPAALERHRAAHAKSEDVLARVHFDATRVMPRRDGKRLLLSWLDEILLSALDGTEFRSAMDLIQQRRNNRSMEIVMHVADMVIPARLLTWARQRPEAVALKWRKSKAWEWHTAAFRLTAHGRRLVEDGLTSVAEAPPFPCGGWAAYDAQRPWAWEGDEEAWRFVKLKRAR